MYTQEERIAILKMAADSIKQNAESIVGSEQYQGSLSVHIYLDPGETPRINVDKDFTPEGFVEYVRNK